MWNCSTNAQLRKWKKQLKRAGASRSEIKENVCFVRPRVKTASIGISPAVMLITGYFHAQEEQQQQKDTKKEKERERKKKFIRIITEIDERYDDQQQIATSRAGKIEKKA